MSSEDNEESQVKANPTKAGIAIGFDALEHEKDLERQRQKRATSPGN